MDPYYSVDKFRVAYAQLIPAMPNKTQWPKATHGFFMYPPLLKPTSGRRRNQRFKGCTDKNKKKDSISVIFVWRLGITGIHVKRVIQKTRKL